MPLELIIFAAVLMSIEFTYIAASTPSIVAPLLGALVRDVSCLSFPREQDVLLLRLVTTDSFEWSFPPHRQHFQLLLPPAPSPQPANPCLLLPTPLPPRVEEHLPLQYVGGVDVSFSAHTPNLACAMLVVLSFPHLQVLHSCYETVYMTEPYVSGFLAFRECSVLARLLQHLKESKPALTPQVLLVDGNGVLHPRGFGLASHLGVIADIPTIGVGKKMLQIDGLTATTVRQLSDQHCHVAGDAVALVGDSGRIWAAAMKSHDASCHPILVSTGHRVSLPTAVCLVSQCCRYRIPEPIRQADMLSRAHLRTSAPLSSS